MPNETMIMTLAKVLIAAAWADGDLSLDEVNTMKELLFRIPELNARQWAELEIYMDAPVGEAERQRLVQDLNNAISSEEGKALAMSTLDEMVQSDGNVSEEERRVVAEIEAAIESANAGRMGGFSRLIRGRSSKRTEPVPNAPNRELYLDDFMHNRVYYDVRRRLDMGDIELDLPDEALRKLSLAGGLMAQVARVNPEITDSELETIVSALDRGWQLGEDQAAFVAGVAISDAAKSFDYFQIAREFGAVYTPDECVTFVEVLFTIAAADGDMSYAEEEEIRTIAGTLMLTHRQYIDAKMKVKETMPS